MKKLYPSAGLKVKTIPTLVSLAIVVALYLRMPLRNVIPIGPADQAIAYQIPSVCSRDGRIIPGDRIGQVAIGMTYAELVSILGKPSVDRTAQRFRVAIWSDPSIGVHGGSLTVDFLDSVARYAKLDLPFALARCQTATGLRVGSGLDGVRLAYGNPSGTYQTTTGFGHLTALAYDNDSVPGILFLASGNVVT